MRRAFQAFRDRIDRNHPCACRGLSSIDREFGDSLPQSSGTVYLNGGLATFSLPRRSAMAFQWRSLLLLVLLAVAVIHGSAAERTAESEVDQLVQQLEALDEGEKSSAANEEQDQDTLANANADTVEDDMELERQLAEQLNDYEDAQDGVSDSTDSEEELRSEGYEADLDGEKVDDLLQDILDDDEDEEEDADFHLEDMVRGGRKSERNQFWNWGRRRRRRPRKPAYKGPTKTVHTPHGPVVVPVRESDKKKKPKAKTAKPKKKVIATPHGNVVVNQNSGKKKQSTSKADDEPRWRATPHGKVLVNPGRRRRRRRRRSG